MSIAQWKFAAYTAWREARRQRKRLVLCALSIAFGVAALVAVDSFSANLESGLDEEAKALLGADLQITARSAFGSEAEAIFKQVGGDQSREIRFASMAYFPGSDGSRLVQVRALGGAFPYYGEFETAPAGVDIAQSEAPIVVMDPLIMRQFELEVGDIVRLGSIDFTIAAELIRVPGEAAFAGIFAPRLYIPLAQLESTGLIEVSSIALYRLYAANLELPADTLIESIQSPLDAAYLKAKTVKDRKGSIRRPLERLSNFLGLVGFVALLLGGVGIAGAVHAYLMQKRDTVAILRCLGSSSAQASGIFWIQVATIALLGALAGAAGGVFCQAALPRLLAPVLPFDLDFFVSWPSIGVGILYGASTAFLAGIFPLLPLRKVSPLRALRSDFDMGTKQADPAVRMLSVFALLAITAFAASRTDVWWHGAVFIGVLVLVVAILSGVAALVKRILRSGFQPRSFLLRQASANLHRPQNRTLYLTTSLGVGTFLIYTLTLIQTGLLQQTELANESDTPNLLFFDVQPDQLEGVQAILAERDLAFTTASPVVTMRLSAIKGQSVASVKQDPELDIKHWVLNREWRSTYRSAPGKGELVSGGDYIGDWTGKSEPVPISLEDDLARHLGVVIGDRLTYDVQGMPIEVEVSSLRTVDWTQMWPNFFATFPIGVLEPAPQWWIGVTRSPDIETTAALQSAIFHAYPNVSAVDLNAVIEALQNVFGRISFAVRFMGLFTMATGIIILANAVTASRHQRVRESVLLRTMGASGRQIRLVLAAEYALIGLISGVVGVGLALAAAASLGSWVFKVDFYVPWLQIAGAIGAVVSLSVITGLLCSRGIASQSPLAILRGD